MSYDLKVLHVKGTAQEVGQAIGEELKDSLRTLIPMRLEATMEVLAIGHRQLEARFRSKGLQAFENYRQLQPRAGEELASLCEVAGVEPWLYHLAANMTDYRDHVDPKEEGCTSALLRSSDGSVWSTQTWDLAEENLDHVVVIDREVEGLRRVSLCCSAFPPLMGMNQWGLTWGTTNTKTSDIGDGLGYQWVLDGLSRIGTLLEASQWLKAIPKAGSHTYHLSQDLGGEQHDHGHLYSKITPLLDTPIFRTNHPVFSEHERLQLESPGSSSLSRLKRCHSFWDGKVDVYVGVIQDFLSDREDGADSISRLPEDQTGVTTNACMIAHSYSKRLWFCRGDAHRGQWKFFQL